MRSLAILGTYLALVGCGETIPDEPEDTAKDDAVAFYQSLIKLAGPCDAAFEVAGAEMGKGDVVRAYRAVEVAESACLQVNGQISNLEIPASVGKATYEAFGKAQEQCATVYSNKWYALSNIAEVLDGKGGVAEAARAQGSLENLQAGTLMCVGSLLEPMMALGVDIEQIPDQ